MRIEILFHKIYSKAIFKTINLENPLSDLIIAQVARKNHGEIRIPCHELIVKSYLCWVNPLSIRPP